MKSKGTEAQIQDGHLISPLAEGNKALREKKYTAAIDHYLLANTEYTCFRENYCLQSHLC